MSNFNPNDSLENILAGDIDTSEVVSFNFPKYRDLGVPFDVWMRNVNLVEEGLELLLQNAPLSDQYPMMHLRSEKLDDSGAVIRVDLQIIGKSYLVAQGISIFNRTSVSQYVTSNMLNSEEASKAVEGLAPETIEIANKIKSGMFISGKSISQGAQLVSGVGMSPEEIKATVEKQYDDAGIDGVEVSVIPLNLSQSELDSDDNPLDLSMDEDDVSEMTIPFLLPNPDPDEFN